MSCGCTFVSVTRMTLGTRLQRARRKAGATLEETATELRVTVRTLIRWEQDDCTPEGGALVRILTYLQKFDASLELADIVPTEPARAGR